MSGGIKVKKAAYNILPETEDTLKRMQIFDVINSTGNKVELEKVTYNNEYYIKLYNY